jgi:hypothetical protein
MAAVEDRRVDRTKAHDLQDILVLSVLAVLCGAEGCEDIELFADGGGDYVLAIKDNHPTLHKAMSEHFDQVHEKGCIETGVRYHHTSDAKLPSTKSKVGFARATVRTI